MTEKECREAWNKHQTKCQLGEESYQLEDMMDYMEFRSEMGIEDEEEY